MKLEEIEKPINVLLVIAKLSLQIGISVGALIIIIYCGKIDYYPTGVTFGDGLLFIAASLAFSFTYALAVLGLFCVGITISPFLRWLQKSILHVISYVRSKDTEVIPPYVNFPPIGWDKFGIVIVGLFLLFMISLNITIGIGLLGASLFMSLTYGLWHTDPPNSLNGNKDWERKVRISLVVAAFLVPIIVSKSQGNMLNQAMTLIGIRNESAVVQVSEKYAKFLESNGITSNHPITQNGAIYKAAILFNGIGTNTVIEVEGVKLILPAKEIIIAFMKSRK